MTICPKECPDRHPGCHDHCERYAENKAAYIYTNLGNGINHELCMKFVKSGYDLKVIEESV